MAEAVYLEELSLELICPITQELFEDPISVPCCGKAFSRLPLIQYFEKKGQNICPMCNKEILGFDPLSAPKNVIIAGMVDSFNKLKNGHKKKEEDKVENIAKQKWSATFLPILDNNGTTLPVGDLKINLENATFITKPSLFIAVVDRSGSMSGNPFKQVEAALVHIMGLTRSNPFVKTVIVAYASTAEIINTTGTQADVIRVIRTMFTGGGTNFNSAFDKVKEVLSKYICSDDEDKQKLENNVSNVIIAFLTDGQSEGTDRKKLVTDFTLILNDCWKGPVSVHSIGFGAGCDKEFLEGLWKAGTVPGTFRYAEPGDDCDSLCNKLTSLFELVSKSSTVTINLKLDGLKFWGSGGTITDEKKIQFPIGENGKGQTSLWTICNNNQNLGNMVINSHLDDNVEIPITLNKNNNMQVRKIMFNRWISILIDELAAELVELSKKDKNNYGLNLFDLHCGLLEQKGEAIAGCIDVEETGSVERLEFILKEIVSLRSGVGINLGKLSDLRFGSQYLPLAKKNIPSDPRIIDNTKANPQLTNEKVARECQIYYSRNNNGKGRSRLQECICYNLYNKITNDITSELEKTVDINFKDVDGNTAFLLAAYCGQSYTVEAILKKFKDVINLEEENNKGETAMTLAIKARGFWKAINILLEAGAKIPAERRKGLEQYAIDNGFLTTGNLIGNMGENTADIHDRMTTEYITFVYNRAINNGWAIDVQNYLKIALAKQMIELVKALVAKHDAKPTTEMLMDLCQMESSIHLQLTEMLLNFKYKDGPIDINSCDENGDSLLFRAAERGSLDHVKLFIARGAKLDLPNKLGNTPLWIACWKRYPCIINELLDSGADVNFVNLKGNPPMYSICQKGPKKIAEQLLARGADPNILNSNGDTLVLLCCRNGQSEVLQLLLNQADPDIVNHVAHIDGFNAMLAATESNRSECIKILHEHRFDLEAKTAEDNPILASATPLHLAAYYGKSDAARTLLSLGANPNSKDKNNQTPLHIAVIQGNSSIIRLLRNAGADLTIRDSMGNSAASYCRNDSDEIKKMLTNPALEALMRLARGEFNSKEEKEACQLLLSNAGCLGCLSKEKAIELLGPDGTTPLMEAIIHSNQEVVRTLLELGADPKKKNNHGINSFVWSSWIRNPKIKLILPTAPSKIEKYLTRLKKAAMGNSQNAMILFVSAKPNKLMSIPRISGIGTKIDSFVNSLLKSDSCGNPVVCDSNDTSSYLESILNEKISSKPGELSIVDVLEKVELNKDAEQQKEIMKTLIWKAKVFTTSLIASGTTNLNPQHIMALYMYSTNSCISGFLNQSLIEKNLGILDSYLKQLNDGLELLPAFEGEVFMATNFVENRNAFLPGQEIRWQTFMSGSTLWRVATENTKEFATPKKQGTVFLIKSKTGRFIGQHSPFPYDAEVVFLPSTKFIVTAWYRGDPICLGQANIREHTFKIKEEDMHKMIDSNSSLIVELTQ